MSSVVVHFFYSPGFKTWFDSSDFFQNDVLIRNTLELTGALLTHDYISLAKTLKRSLNANHGRKYSLL